jgi:capsular exopolysaccharide synthesis family protein
MTNDHKKNGGDRKSAGMPVPYKDNLPATEIQKPFYTWQEKEEVSLHDYLDVIVRRKWLIITFLMLVFLSTLIFTLTTTKIYKAMAVIEVNQASPQVTKFEEVLGSEVLAREFYETQVELIGSKTLLDRIIDKLNLIEHPVLVETLYGDGKPGAIHHLKKFIKSILPGYKDKGGDSVVSAEILKQQKLVDYLGENLEASPSRKSMLIYVSFNSPDPKLSRDVVNSILDEFIGRKMEQKLEASGIARDFLMLQIDRAKINLEKAEEDLNRFGKLAGIVSLDAKVNSIYRQLEDLNLAYTEAEADVITKKVAYQQASKDGHANLPRVLESTLIANLKENYAQLRSEYEDLKTTFHDDYPEVRNLKARMISIAARIEQEEARIFSAIKNEYMTARMKAAAMQERIELQKKLVLDLNERATQYSIMTREVETNKAIYQSLLERVKEIESMAGVSASNIQIVDRASLPIFPIKPNVKLNLLLAIVIGLLGGIGCAFLSEYFADTITNPEEISERFHIPILGIIPQVKADDTGVENTFLRHPRAPFSEAIRSSRVSIQLSGADTRSKSFLVTSGLPNEGKTTIAVNLALSFAAAGERVILIDVDFRKPSLQEVFTISKSVNGYGLSSFLAAVTSKVCTYNRYHKNLSIIPCGPVPPNPVELLASKRFQRLLKHLVSRYDRVILDAPPYIGFADVLVLSQRVGGIVLVSSIGEASRVTIGQFKKTISNIHGTILGCIVNKVDLDKKYGYGSYYKYYQAYRHYYGEDHKATERLLPSAAGSTGEK